MSEIPIQSASSRGAHEADDAFDGDVAAYDDGDAATYDNTASSNGVAASSFNGVPEFEPVSAVDLDSDPFADDLSKELAHAAPKTWFNRTTVIIGGLALIVGGFLGGVQVQKHYGSSSSTNSAANSIANLRNQFRNGAGGEGGNFPGFGGGGGAGAATGGASAAAAQTGTVKFVDGTTIYVTLADGTVLTVKTDGSTKVITSTTTKLSTLKVGQTVSIGGSKPDSSGNMTATSVTATK